MRILAAVAAAVLVSSGPLSAHDVPDDVVVQGFVRPDGQRLRLLVRVPLQAMRDVDVPTRGPGYLDVARADAALRHAATLWIAQGVEVFEDGQPVGPGTLAAVRASLPSDGAFSNYDAALAQVTGAPLDAGTEVYWDQGALDALVEYPIHRSSSRFAVHADFRRLGQRVTVGLRLVTPDGAVRAFEWHGDPGRVDLDPRWHQAARSFAWAGLRHVVSGADHLLFLLCVAIPLRRLRPLVLVVSSFTLAHALTLVASAYGLAPDALWFPPLVETLIAASIVWMALENIVWGAGGAGPSPALGRRWAVTTIFGLVHGFGFSFALRERLQFAGSHLLTSLLAFNVGVEVAQLGVILFAAGAVAWLFARVVEPRVGAIILSAVAAHTGWHWMAERAEVLRQFPWPAVGMPALASAGVWLAMVVAAGLTAWAVRALMSARDIRARRVEPGAPTYS